MEEDLKILEEVACSIWDDVGCDVYLGKTERDALNNLLTRYKEERDLRIHYENRLDNMERLYVDKDKVKEKMKKYEWSLNGYDSSTADYKHSQCIGRYLALQELLREE